MRMSDWSSDVCSSDLDVVRQPRRIELPGQREAVAGFGKTPLPVVPAPVNLEQSRVLRVNRRGPVQQVAGRLAVAEGKGRSEEHTSELQSLMRISYAVFCLKKNKTRTITHHITPAHHRSTRSSE